MDALPEVVLDRLPRSVEEFLTLRDAVAGTPQGGAAMMVVALLLYATDEALGAPCLAVAVDRGRLQEGDGGYRGWELRPRDRQLIRSQAGGRPHLLRSYVQGATPDSGYRLPDPPYRIACGANPYSGDVEEGRFKVFLSSSGAASARPVTVRRNRRGIWKAEEWSSLLLGVQAPAAEEEDDL